MAYRRGNNSGWRSHVPLSQLDFHSFDRESRKEVSGCLGLAQNPLYQLSVVPLMSHSSEYVCRLAAENEWIQFSCRKISWLQTRQPSFKITLPVEVAGHCHSGPIGVQNHRHHFARALCGIGRRTMQSPTIVECGITGIHRNSVGDFVAATLDALLELLL